MLAIPVVVRNGASVLLAAQDLVATNEPENLSRNVGNPTTITAAQLAEADFLFSNPGTPEDIVLLPTAEEIIVEITTVDNESCNGCAGGQIVNTTVWAQHDPLVSSCGSCPGQSARLPEGYSFRRTFYRNSLNLATPLYLEIPPTGTPGLTWEDILDNIGTDVETPARDAVLFHNNEWKTLVFWILNSSPQQSLVGNATIGTAIITCDPTLITTATVGMRFYTGNDSVFVSSEGELTVTAIDYFSGEITVSGNAIATQANLSFTLTPHIKIMPAQSGLFLNTDEIDNIFAHRQWLEYWLTDDGSAGTPLTTTGLKNTDRPPPFKLVPGVLPRLQVTIPSSDGVVEVDVKIGSTGGAGGTSMFDTLPTIDEGEYTSKNAAVPAVMANNPTEVIDDQEISFLVTATGVDVIGLKIKLYVEFQPVDPDF